MEKRIALFGNVHMEQGYCPDCAGWYFIRKGVLQCCDRRADDTAPTHSKRIVEPEWQRRTPSPADQREILIEQDNACFYCRQFFGDVVPKGPRNVRLKIHWDHFTPYAHTADNRPSNFVAACHVCNGWKSDRIFATDDDARRFLDAKWTKARAPRAKTVRRMRADL